MWCPVSHHFTVCCQGALGDCWAIATISAVAEYALNKDDNADTRGLFQTTTYDPGQPVRIQLYKGASTATHHSNLSLTVIEVPDYFPTTDGITPCFARPYGGLHKAYVSQQSWLAHACWPVM